MPLGSFGNSCMLGSPSLGNLFVWFTFNFISCKNSWFESLLHAETLSLGFGPCKPLVREPNFAKLSFESYVVFSTFENILFGSLLGNLKKHLVFRTPDLLWNPHDPHWDRKNRGFTLSSCWNVIFENLMCEPCAWMRLEDCVALCLALWKTGSRICQPLGTLGRRTFGNATNARSNRFLDAVRSLHYGKRPKALVVGKMWNHSWSSVHQKSVRRSTMFYLDSVKQGWPFWPCDRPKKFLPKHVRP